MKRLITAAFLAALAGQASAEDVKLQLKWVTQAQFAGYYVAQAKGFYEEEGTLSERPCTRIAYDIQ